MIICADIGQFTPAFAGSKFYTWILTPGLTPNHLQKSKLDDIIDRYATVLYAVGTQPSRDKSESLIQTHIYWLADWPNTSPATDQSTGSQMGSASGQRMKDVSGTRRQIRNKSRIRNIGKETNSHLLHDSILS